MAGPERLRVPPALGASIRSDRRYCVRPMTCDRHPGVLWYLYPGEGGTYRPCFLCQPDTWPPLKTLEHPEELLADIVGEMVSSGHWPHREDIDHAR
jgi:hypothetical protein